VTVGVVRTMTAADQPTTITGQCHYRAHMADHQEPHTPSPVTPPAKSPRPKWLVPLVVACVLLALAGASTAVWALTRDQAAKPAPAATTAAAVASATAGQRDPIAQRACDEMRRVMELPDPPVTDPTSMITISELAADATDVDIRVRGAFLREAANLAEASKGADDEFAMTAGLMTAALEFRTACVKGHYGV
jgi:hypothetical protein